MKAVHLVNVNFISHSTFAKPNQQAMHCTCLHYKRNGSFYFVGLCLMLIDKPPLPPSECKVTITNSHEAASAPRGYK